MKYLFGRGPQTGDLLLVITLRGWDIFARAGTYVGSDPKCARSTPITDCAVRTRLCQCKLGLKSRNGSNRRHRCGATDVDFGWEFEF